MFDGIAEVLVIMVHLKNATPASMLICCWLSVLLWHRNASLVDALNSINAPMAILPPGPVQDLLSRFTASADRVMRPAVARQLTALASSSAMHLSALDAAHLLVYSLEEGVAVNLADTDVLGLMVPLLNGCSMPLTTAAQGLPLYLGDSTDQQLFDGLSACLVDTSSLSGSCVQR